MVEKLFYNRDEVKKEYLENCEKTQFCDITDAVLVKRRNGVLKSIPGLYPWNLKREEEKDAIVVHYVKNKTQMVRLHQLLNIDQVSGVGFS